MHDASRLEWVVSVPLRANQDSDFTVEFELEVPAHLFSAHDYWRSLQMLSRFESPLEGGAPPPQATHPDELRELALSFAHRIKVLRQSLVRECFMANSMLAPPPTPRRAYVLVEAFVAVQRQLGAARAELLRCTSPELARERELADEFLSNQMLDFLTHAHRAIDEQLLRAGGPHTEALREVAAGFARCVSEGLGQEVTHREACGYLTPTTNDAAALERYLERANALKKHFQGFLFLRPESIFVDSQLRSWGGVAGAMAASVFAFGINKSLMGAHAAQASLGLGALATAGAVVYAIQDRIKEMGRNFLSAKVGRYYAQRVTQLFAPARPNKRDRRIATLRESLTAKPAERPDALNPDLSRRPVVIVRYQARGRMRAEASAGLRPMHGVKQIFRYDLSWLFARLDDPLKAVPIVHRGGSMSLAAAPRCYRLPAVVRLHTASGSHEEAVVAVMHKRGLERCEPAPAVAMQAPLAAVAII
jgi:hypothetical protein